jgi:hypothetical protein
MPNEPQSTDEYVESESPDEAVKGDYIDSSKRGFDPELRPYRVTLYVLFGVIVVWFCSGMLFSVIDRLF